MKLNLPSLLLGIGAFLLLQQEGEAQITLMQDYVNKNSAPIGTYKGISYREAGFSSLYPIANTNGTEFWTISDRGVNIDCANANPAGCHPTYDKMYAFPSYAPKIHRIRVKGDSIQILQTITMKRPNGTTATGLLNPTGFGSTTAEVASTDTVLNCANFTTKTAAKDIWGIDSEGIVVDKDGNFWICEEGGPTIWKLDRNGVVSKRFSPYANLAGAESQDVAIDTVFKYRKNNRGFEGISIAPNGKIYAIIQSPILYPSTSIGEGTRIHRILEIDPIDNSNRMFAYLNDGIIGASGSNQIRLRDWKIGDMAAINNNEFLVIEAAARGTSDIKRLYKINISNATPVHSGLYGGKTLEALVDETGLTSNSITPVTKTLVMDLLANGWPSVLDKAEGLAIINDSTIAIVNDNDYGQTCPNADGLAIATTNLSHLIKFSLKGANKFSNYQPYSYPLAESVTGPSTSTTPYLLPITQGVKISSILSAGDVIGGYKMCGTPDGLGAFDNNNGTFTLLMNHEFDATKGINRAYGNKGTFVSKWIINKSDLSVVSGSDLTQNLKLWNGTGYTTYNSSNPSPTALSRFCSADLPAIAAYYNSKTGLGTQERIFMNGEESGNEGRVIGHIVTGTEGGTSYELPALGKASWENYVARPVESDKTVVIGMDDSTPGQVYVYIGTKTTTGSEVDKAGLTNGKLYGVGVNSFLTETDASIPAAGAQFSLIDLGDVKNLTGATIETNSTNLGVTKFLRPEDGAWDPSNLNDFYFATTNGINNPSRLWRLRFSDVNNPEAGGTIEAVLDGTEGQKMLDNLTIDHYGHILLVEDVGNNAHIGRVLQYNIANDKLTTVSEHDRTRFLTGGANFLTQDEEASGILDVQEILGPGMFLVDVQAHYGTITEVVEGGQLLAFFNPDSYNAYLEASPEISIKGKSIEITNGSTTTTVNNGTDLGQIATGTTISASFVIQNTGSGSLAVSNVNFSGVNASDFTLEGVPTLPFNVTPGGSQLITVKLNPQTDGLYLAKLTITSNDSDESNYEFVIGAIASTPTVINTGTLAASGINVYPNPAGDVATISINMNESEHVTITIFDTKGNKVASSIERNLIKGKNEIVLSTSTLENGVYNVQISSPKGSSTIKTIVAH